MAFTAMTAPSGEHERARVIHREGRAVSPWVTLNVKTVEFVSGGPPQRYHTVATADYIAILAMTPGGLVPIVRQYRPAVEAYTWELPAGMIDEGETPEESCRRELKEETGLDAESMIYLGAYYSDTGRLENRTHAFFVNTGDPPGSFQSEPGMTVRYVSESALYRHIMQGSFQPMLHVGVLAAARCYLNPSIGDKPWITRP